MPKMKNRRAAQKRFSTTGTGKLKRFHANHSHILTKKTRKRKRNLRQTGVVAKADLGRVKDMLVL
jgi:large subunit ribosomal protein L35